MNEEIKGIEIDNELEEKIDESLQNDQRKFILKEKMKVLKHELGEDSWKSEEVNAFRTILEKLKIDKKIKEHMKKYDDVFINSNEYCIPHILNLSIIGVKPETMLHALEMDDIYISTQSACSTGQMSKPVFAVTNDEKRALSSLRISISNYTTKEELDLFLKSFDKNYKKLILK